MYLFSSLNGLEMDFLRIFAFKIFKNILEVEFSSFLQSSSQEGQSSKSTCPGGNNCGEGDEGKESEKEIAKEKSEVALFQLVVVNSYGTQEVKRLHHDDTTLRLTSEERRWELGGLKEGGFVGFERAGGGGEEKKV